MAAKKKAELLLEIDRLKAELNCPPIRSRGLNTTTGPESNSIPGPTIANVSDAVVSADSEFSIQSWNRAAEKLYGWSAQEVIGQGFGEIVPTNYIEVDGADVFDEFHEAGLWQGEVIQQHKNGSDIYVFDCDCFKRTGWKSVGRLAVNRDITDRKYIEQKLHEKR